MRRVRARRPDTVGEIASVAVRPVMVAYLMANAAIAEMER